MFTYNLPLRKWIVAVLFFPLISFGQEKKYFQQHVAYTIHVSLDDKKHELSGDETIVYKNNSTSSFGYIYMHLWPNAYKNQNTALAKQLLENGETKFYYSKPEERGYIDGLDWKVNGKPVLAKTDSQYIDICKLVLNEPLNPGDSIVITTPFHVKIPRGIYSRLGHIDQQYQITQWYPKPAVFDKNGWNQMPYLNQGEFYSEYGSFDVHITTPKNYVIGATGDLVNNPEEINWLTEKAKKGIEGNTGDNTFPASDTATKTLHFHQNNVHDFAWFADKRYLVLKGEVKTPNTNQLVTTWAMFTPSEAGLWKNSIQYLNDAIYYYSLWNGDYPYNHCTAVDGSLSAGGGMEYPTITVIGKTNSAMTLETVIMHEVGHNWFYGILGSNERMHPWMDEGINSYNESRYVRTKYPNASILSVLGMDENKKILGLNRFKHRAQYELTYLLSARSNSDQPMEYPSHHYTAGNYGAIVYSKSATMFNYLANYLGQETFDRAMQRYFQTWKFKHPQPEDLRKILEEESKTNLAWFFNDMMKTTGKLDYKLKRVKKDAQGNYLVTLKNKGDYAGPMAVNGIKDGKVMATTWTPGTTASTTLTLPAGNYDLIKLDYAEEIPELNRSNNSYRVSKVLPKVEQFQLRFMAGINNPDKTTLYIAPALGWNNYNKIMLGVSLYNNLIPQQPFEFAIAPMIGLGNKQLAGVGMVQYHVYPKAGFKSINLSLQGRRFGVESANSDLYYNKLMPQAECIIKPSRARSSITQSLKFRSVYIFGDRYKAIAVSQAMEPGFKNKRYSIHELTYTLTNKRSINPNALVAGFQQSTGFFKGWIEFTGKLNYRKKNKYLGARFYAGNIFKLKNNVTNYQLPYGIDFRQSLSGKRGPQDYMFDELYLGRSENYGSGIISHQFAMGDGGFKLMTGGYSERWMLALNLTTTLPWKIPFKVYADVGYFGNYGTVYPIYFDTGIELTLVKDICTVYFPVWHSEKIKIYQDLNPLYNNYWREVRFVFNITKLSPYALLKQFTL